MLKNNIYKKNFDLPVRLGIIFGGKWLKSDFIITWFGLFLLLLSLSFGTFVLSFVNLIMIFFF